MPRAKEHLDTITRPPVLGLKSRRAMLRLDMNEHPLGLPQDFVKEVLGTLTPEDLATYPEYTGLIRKIAAQDGVAENDICLSNGSDAAIKYLFDVYVSPGDRVLITDPTFAMYPVYTRMTEADPVAVQYPADFTFPVAGFLKALQTKPQMAVLVNPNNPTGVTCSDQDLQHILECARCADVLLIVDEAYYHFYGRTVLRYLADNSNLVVLRTFSKLCGLAALRLGYAVASPAVVEKLHRVKPTFDVNGLACLFAERLLDHPSLISDMVAALNNGKALLIGELKRLEIDHRDGQANFVLIRCPGRVAEIIQGLHDKGILVAGGFSQPLLKDFIRVTLGNPAQMITFLEAFVPLWHQQGDAHDRA